MLNPHHESEHRMRTRLALALTALALLATPILAHAHPATWGTGHVATWGTGKYAAHHHYGRINR